MWGVCATMRHMSKENSLIVALAFCAMSAFGATFHVDPSAAAGGDGSFLKPFATLAAARDAVREAHRKSSISPAESVEIVLAPGDYVQTSSFELDGRDGGMSGDLPLVWRAAAAGTARILGMKGAPATDGGELSRILEPARGKALERPLVLGKDGLSHVRFEGIVFGYTAGDCVSLKGDDIRLNGCRIMYCGGTGVSLRGDGNEMRGCEVAQVGGSGVVADGGDRRTLRRAESVFENNHVHHFAIFRRTGASGVEVQGCGITLRANVIHDAPRSAVMYGGNEHLFEYNNVYRVLMEADDAGQHAALQPHARSRRGREAPERHGILLRRLRLRRRSVRERVSQCRAWHRGGRRTRPSNPEQHLLALSGWRIHRLPRHGAEALEQRLRGRRFVAAGG